MRKLSTREQMAYRTIATLELERDAALGREAALREELEAESKGSDRAAESLMEWRRDCVAIQQRLTVAEQRVGELKKLLCDVINEAPTGFAALKVDLSNRVNDALKPAAEGEGS